MRDNYPSLVAAANYVSTGGGMASISHSMDINQKYHPLFDHGMCKWPGCELLFDDFQLFTKYVPPDLYYFIYN